MGKLSDTRTKLRSLKWFYRNFKLIPDFVSWEERQWRSPAPSHVKRTFLSNRNCQLWIESGTYHGDTTHILSSSADMVVTFESDRALYEKAFLRLDSKTQISKLFMAKAKTGLKILSIPT